ASPSTRRQPASCRCWHHPQPADEPQHRREEALRHRHL
ncbi:MAG: hypothetical protein AVDCRST_MAG08-2797, partial [uncultured Acetobacteraceae bacterium]